MIFTYYVISKPTHANTQRNVEILNSKKCRVFCSIVRSIVYCLFFVGALTRNSSTCSAALTVRHRL